MIKLRPARLTDMATLFDWRNDPDTYRYFRNPNPITAAEHRFWVDSVMNQIQIAEQFDNRIAMVRFDDTDGPAAEVSITMAPHKRRQGLGYIVLSLAVKDALIGQQFSAQIPLLAQIHRENIASKRIFEQCHFEELATDGDFVLYRREPQ